MAAEKATYVNYVTIIQVTADLGIYSSFLINAVGLMHYVMIALYQIFGHLPIELLVFLSNTTNFFILLFIGSLTVGCFVQLAITTNMRLLIKVIRYLT